MSGLVYAGIPFIETWFGASNTPFFPEYTDHSLNHVEKVILSASGLIRDSARRLISSGDAAVLIISAILHDAAMHIVEDTFVELISPRHRHPLLIDFDGKSWPELWHGFLAEARRFDERALMALFGDTEPVHAPPADPIDYTLRDRLLIGEFLRRNHPRLAHEFAVFGIPGRNERVHIFPPAADSRLVNLAGLIARSHGHPLREYLPYLRAQYSIWEWRDIHPVFLMALVRIADYVQIESERAPSDLLDIRRLRSPVSRREWRIHAAVDSIQKIHEDPESIEIHWKPDSVRTVMRIREWETGFQSELDVTWAVLGEVYGRFQNLNELGLVIRRIRSNTERADFALTLPFVPKAASFEAAGSEILKLLIKPLYGNRPEIGIRELVQNAVDAVLELRQFRLAHENVECEFNRQEADVLLALEKRSDGSWWLTISDHGIGMTPETIREYFLRVGASFRQSTWWRSHFIGIRGNSEIPRSGRFGIGVLAAFLLGPEMHLSTRHVESARNRGVRFSVTLDESIVEMRWLARPVGTTIRIRLTPDAALRLHDPMLWDWYCLTDPVIARVIIPDGKTLPQRYALPSDRDSRTGWRRLDHPRFERILWSYSPGPWLVCNGFLIAEKSPDMTLDLGRKMVAKFPKLSVFDPDGNLPLTLQRTELGDELPFAQNLWDDVLKDIIAYLLAFTPVEPLSNPVVFPRYFELKHEGVLFDEGQWSLFFAHSTGISLFEDWFLAELDIRRVIGIVAWGRYGVIPQLKSLSGEALIGIALELSDKGRWLYSVQQLVDAFYKGINGVQFEGFRLVLVGEQPRVWITEVLDIYKDSRPIRLEEDSSYGYQIWAVGRCPAREVHLAAAGHEMAEQRVSAFGAEETHSGLLCEYYLLGDRDPVPLSRLGLAWKEYLGRPFIQYPLEERIRDPRFSLDFMQLYALHRFRLDGVPFEIPSVASPSLSAEESALAIDQLPAICPHCDNLDLVFETDGVLRCEVCGYSKPL